MLPHPIAPETLLAQLHWRYATKRFDPEARVDPSTWHALEQSLVLAPSSFGLQPWHFLVVTDPATREKLRTVSWNQPQITECSHLVVFAYRRGLGPGDVARFVERVAAVRRVPRESLAEHEQRMAAHVRRPAPFDVDEWSRRQLYIALGTFLTSAALLGVDACPMEGIEPAKYDALLGLDTRGYATACVAAAGRRAPDDRYASLAKVRFEASEVVGHVGPVGGPVGGP